MKDCVCARCPVIRRLTSRTDQAWHIACNGSGPEIRVGPGGLVRDCAHQFLSEVLHVLLIDMDSVPGLEVEEKP